MEGQLREGGGEQDVDITVGTHSSSHCLQSINLTLKALEKPPMHCLKHEEPSRSPPTRQEKKQTTNPPKKEKESSFQMKIPQLNIAVPLPLVNTSFIYSFVR